MSSVQFQTAQQNRDEVRVADVSVSLAFRSWPAYAKGRLRLFGKSETTNGTVMFRRLKY